MSKFRVGDLVEVVMVTRQTNAYLLGMEATITRAFRTFHYQDPERRQADFYNTSIDKQIAWDLPPGVQPGWYPDQLRLKRPPSWDSWLYDTSHVQNESTAGETA